MSISGRDNKGPSIAELQRYIREKTRMEFLLTNGDRLIGTLRWFDEQAFSVSRDDGEQVTILRAAVLGYLRAS